jgi:diguanylate cyclase (GGDEF)-like protein
METSWSLHVLSEILSAFSTEDPDNLRNVLNRVAESVDAEVAAIICERSINWCIGLSEDDRQLLLEELNNQPSDINIRSGTLRTCWAPMGPNDLLFVGRLGERFDLEERSLLRAMARSIELSIKMLTAVSSERSARKNALFQATHDALTGLPNRRMVLERLQATIDNLSADGSLLTAILFIDIDRFKWLNDAHGHSAGDQLLIHISRILTQEVRHGDLVGRLSGDEFIIITRTSDRNDASKLANRIIAAIREPLMVAGSKLSHTVSIGISFAHVGDSPSTLLENADMAMYKAKALGRGRHTSFHSTMRLQAQHRLSLEEALGRSVQNGEITTYLQPIFRLADGTLTGFEALVRWQHPQLGLLKPSAFMEQAEDSGLIQEIDMCVFASACTAIVKWQQIPGLGNLRLSSNLSARSLADPRVKGRIKEILKSSGINPVSVYLEITETTLVDDIASTTATINALRDLGLRLAIDDFGTGYSSLLYLKRFPVGVLKIDRSFVSGLGKNPEDEVIATTILTLAKALELEVVAEGVENEAQMDRMRELGCDYGQGYWFGHPITIEATEVTVIEPLRKAPLTP